MMKFFREPYREMDSAPRDGSIIELKCYFGIEPWVSKAKWVQDPVAGSIWQMISDSPWKSYVEDRYCSRQDGAGIASLKWRPVRGNLKAEGGHGDYRTGDEAAIRKV